MDKYSPLRMSRCMRCCLNSAIAPGSINSHERLAIDCLSVHELGDLASTLLPSRAHGPQCLVVYTTYLEKVL